MLDVGPFARALEVDCFVYMYEFILVYAALM